MQTIRIDRMQDYKNTYTSGNDTLHYQMCFLGTELYLVKEKCNMFFACMPLLSEIIFVTVVSIWEKQLLESLPEICNRSHQRIQHRQDE